MAKINQQFVLLELESAIPILKREAEIGIREEIFEPAVKEMIEEFDNHKVTKELLAGMNAGNSAGNPTRTLGGDSKKNLYPFIGFEAGTNPVEPIRDALQERRGGRSAGPQLIPLPVKKRTFLFEFEIRAPNLEEIYRRTPLPWLPGFSWAEMLEEGIPGLNQFIPREGAGRSEGGIQANQSVRGIEKSAKIDYMSGIVRNFLDKMPKQ